MDYSIDIPGLEGRKAEVKVSFWSGPKLLIDGQPTAKGSKRGEMVLRRNDGSEVSASWKPQLLGLDVPQLVVDGKVISLVEPLKWHEWVWAGLPALLVFVGGALGAIAGVIAFSISLRIFRTALNGLAKYLVSGLVSAIAVMVYLIAAVLFALIVNG